MILRFFFFFSFLNLVAMGFIILIILFFPCSDIVSNNPKNVFYLAFLKRWNYLIYVSWSFVMPSTKSFVLCFRDKTCGCSRNELYIWWSAQSPWWNLCQGSHCFSRLSQRWSSDVTTFHAMCFWMKFTLSYLKLLDLQSNCAGEKSLMKMDGFIQEILERGYLVVD